MKANLVLPECQPDELISGAIGRTAKLNISDHKIIIQSITRNNKIEMNSPKMLLPIASAYGMDVPTLIRQHTCTPFLVRFSDARNRGVSQFDQEQTRAVNSLYKDLGGYRVCRMCIDEDIEWHGYSYWRRVHQLPGVTHCLKHQHILNYCKSRPFQMCPDQAIEESKEAFPRELSDFSLRYMHVAVALLTSYSVTNRELVLSRLRKAAQLRGIEPQYNALSSKPTLGQYAASKKDASAIADLSRLLCDNPKSDPWRSIDRAISTDGRISTQAVCLAACVLFDCADDAILALGSPTGLTALGRSEDTALQSAQLFAAYIRALGNYSDTAQALDEPAPEVFTALQNLGLPDCSPPIDKASCRALVAFFNGESIATACEKYQVAHGKLETLFRSASPRMSYCASVMHTNLAKIDARRKARRTHA